MSVNVSEQRIELTAVDRASAVFNQVRGSVSNLKTGLDSMNSALASVGVTLGAGAMIALFNQVNNATAALDDMAEMTGASVENLSKLQTVAKIGGHEFEGLTQQMGRMIKGLKSADEDGQKAAKALAFIGVSARDVNGQWRDQGEVLIDVAKKLKGYEDGAGKAALIQDALGKGAERYLPFLKDLAEEGDIAAKTFTRQAQEAEQLGKNINRLKIVFEDARRELVTELTPALVDFTEKLLRAQRATGGFSMGLATMLMTPGGLTGPEIDAKIKEVEGQIDLYERRLKNPAARFARSVIPGADMGMQVGETYIGLLMNQREMLQGMRPKAGPGMSVEDWMEPGPLRSLGDYRSDDGGKAAREAAALADRRAREAERATAAANKRMRDEMEILQKLEQFDAEALQRGTEKHQREMDKRLEQERRQHEDAARDMEQWRQRQAEAYNRAIDKQIQETERLENALTQGIVDGLMRGFERGESIAQNFLNMLKNAFASTVLTAAIQPVMRPVANFVTGAVQGLGNSIFGGGGGIGGFNPASLMGNSFSLDYMSGMSTAMFADTATSAALIESGTAGMAGAGLEAGALGGGMAGFGAALPWVGAGLFAASALGLFGGRGGPKPSQIRLQGDPGSFNIGQGDNVGGWGNLALYHQYAKEGELRGFNDPKLYDQNILNTLKGQWITGSPGEGPQSMIEKLIQHLEPARIAAEKSAQAEAQAAQMKAQQQQALIQSEQKLIDALNNAASTIEDKLGITSLVQAQNELATSVYRSPLDRFAAAREQLEATYTRAIGGDLEAVSGFSGSLQSALSIGRDVYASGPQFQELYGSANRMLQELLVHQREVNSDIMRTVPVAVQQGAQDTVQELRRQTATLAEGLRDIQAELRRLQA